MLKFLSAMVKFVERSLHINGLHSSLRNVYRRCVRFLALRNVIPFTVSNIVISVGQACNYKCRDCGNFAPYAPAKFMRYSFDDLRKWIAQFSESVDRISVVQIQGGEPFLYSDLGKVITLLREIRTGGGANY